MMAIGLSHQIKQHGDRNRRVEVIIHRFSETLCVRFAPIHRRAVGRCFFERGVKATERGSSVFQMYV
jgi:hypothetical protein